MHGKSSEIFLASEQHAFLAIEIGLMVATIQLLFTALKCNVTY